MGLRAQHVTASNRVIEKLRQTHEKPLETRGFSILNHLVSRLDAV